MRRTLFRTAIAGLAVGTTFLGAAWAGVGLGPVSTGQEPVPPAPLPLASEEATDAADLVATEGAAALAARLPDGQWLVGASVRSIAPDEKQWQTEGCSEYVSNFPEEVTHLADKLIVDQTGSWPASPDCVYLGGYGIGPARAATSVDPHAGVNVRTLAFSNGTSEGTVVWQMIDMVGYFSSYRDDLCGDCGIADMRRSIGQEHDIPVDNLAIGSTHTHGGADGYGAWGGLPSWYREQLRVAVITSAAEALGAMRPATIAVGSVDARAFNNERRGTYHSTPDYGAVWLQAREVPRKKKDEAKVIATLVNYAAHPTVLGSQPVMHGDWPATASKALGDDLGGVGVVIEGGLGNVSPSRLPSAGEDLTDDGVYDRNDQVIEMGRDFATFVGSDIARGGTFLTSNEVQTVSAVVEHPVTNWAEAALGISGLLDRTFTPGDAAGVAGWYSGGKSPTRQCTAASPLTIKTEVSGFRLGQLTVLTAPGEIFSSISQVLKSKARYAAFEGGQTMVFGQTQDSLGYIIQSFEVDPVGGALTNVPEAEVAEYEETFMLDRCFGDHVLDVALEVAAAVQQSE
ncbi:MAG TPA: hypothetical protein VMN58_12730 [Acidimicrobiales bacterium]|nr:hypothetical protein [Acidimicrobiales bacterium]